MTRTYSNISEETTLAAGIDADDTALSVAAAVGYPAPPFAVVLDPGSLTAEEVVLVTAAVSTAWTVTRGYDGTTAVAHTAGAIVRHSVIAADLSEPQTHIALTTTAHGGIVPSARTLTIDGVALDLSVNRSWLSAPAWSAITGKPTTLAGYGVTDVLKTGAGVLTLSAAGAYTLTIPATGTVALLGIANTFTLGPNEFRAGGDALVALAARRHSSGSTANLQEWRNESGTPLSFLDQNGYLGLGGITTSSTRRAFIAARSSLSSVSGLNEYYGARLEPWIDTPTGGATALNLAGLIGGALVIASPDNMAQVLGLNFYGEHDGSGTVSYVAGANVLAALGGNGNVTTLFGLSAEIDNYGGGGTATKANGVNVSLYGGPFPADVTGVRVESGFACAIWTDGGEVRHKTGAAATKGIVVQGAASQSANLQEWQSSAGAVLSTISENGYITTRKTSAPADAELATGELALWFDATAGAAKLKIKAKNASGTVVTGEVALA